MGLIPTKEASLFSAATPRTSFSERSTITELALRPAATMGTTVVTPRRGDTASLPLVAFARGLPSTSLLCLSTTTASSAIFTLFETGVISQKSPPSFTTDILSPTVSLIVRSRRGCATVDILSAGLSVTVRTVRRSPRYVEGLPSESFSTTFTDS